jgi:diguanylate cyclase (GGDEF)-like protein
VLVITEDLPALAAAHAYNLTLPVQSRPVTLRMRKKNGSIAWMEVSARVVKDRDTNEVSGTVLVMRDISEGKAHEHELARLALTDGLTGLPNRRSFDQTLEREWLRTLRENSAMSLLLIDLDHFKEFNDSYGHQVGDECLRAVGAVIRTAIRSTDTPCRYGGEEIAVILPAADAGAAARIAEAVRLAVERLGLPHDGKEEMGHRLTASVGAATALSRYGGSMRLPEALVLAADSALYKAKYGGRNRIATSRLVATKTFRDFHPR